jgi:hypothetical protein
MMKEEGEEGERCGWQEGNRAGHVDTAVTFARTSPGKLFIDELQTTGEPGIHSQPVTSRSLGNWVSLFN